MTTAIATKRKLVKLPKSTIEVFLRPCNEKQDLNFVGIFNGTPEQIIARSIQIIDGLTSVLQSNDFSVKIESLNLSQTVYLDKQNLFDSEFNIIGETADFINADF
jgi:hypothetical protein